MKRSTTLVRLAVALLLLAAVFQVPAAQSAECTEGTFKNVVTGPNCSCQEEGVTASSTPKDRYQCIGGVWVYQFSFCASPFCHG